MANILGISLATLALLALLAALAMFCHGIAARMQMHRYKKAAARNRSSSAG